MRAEVLGRRLQEMLGPGAGVGWAEVTGPEGLFASEAQAVAQAVPKRVAEFAAGRRAARAALAALGRPESEIPVSPYRAPVWPEGARGAITHDRGVAMAAVITKPGSIGIDLTEAAPLPDGTRATILPHPEEADLTDLEARAAFSAKESLFKALFPNLGTFFGFDAAVYVHVTAPGIISLRLSTSLGSLEANSVLPGFVFIEGADLMTVIEIPEKDQ